MPQILDDEGFAARLKTHPAGVYLFFGEEEFLKRRAAQRLQALVTENEAFNVHRVSLGAKDDCVGVLRSEIANLPFLSDLRYVRIDHCAFWQLSGADADAFCDALKAAPEDLILVLYYPDPEASLSKKTPSDKGENSRVTGSRVYRNLPESVCVVDFRHKTPEFLSGYLVKKLAQNGVSVEKSVALQCVTRCDLDLERIETVFAALSARAQTSGGVLTAQILDEYVEQTPEEKVYLFTSAVQERKLSESVRIYRRLRANKFEPIILNAALTKTITQLLAVKTGKDVQKQFHISDYPYKLLKASARLWSEEELREGLRVLSRADYLFKNTSLDPDGLLQELLVRLCQRSANT